MQPLTRRALVRGTAASPGVLLLSQAAASASGRPTSSDEVASLLAHDMVGRHAGRMHGVPDSYNWAKGPRVGRGNDSRGFRALAVWGQIYEDADGSPARNVRVACRDISVWVRSRRTGRWRRLNSSKGVFGHNYVEDFADDVHQDADLRQERNGSVSATLGNGYNFHFSSTRPRAVIDPSDVAGVVALYSARVVMDDPGGPDERHLARYLASAGADYWLDTEAEWDHGRTNADVGIGKARYLGPDWLTLTMSSLSLRRLRRSAPPVTLRGR